LRRNPHFSAQHVSLVFAEFCENILISGFIEWRRRNVNFCGVSWISALPNFDSIFELQRRKSA